MYFFYPAGLGNLYNSGPDSPEYIVFVFSYVQCLAPEFHLLVHMEWVVTTTGNLKLLDVMTD